MLFAAATTHEEDKSKPSEKENGRMTDLQQLHEIDAASPLR
jgi:hypothetical protein